LSVFSPQAIHYLWRNKIREKVKYGLYPYSCRCFGVAQIFLPFYGDKNNTSIDIEVGLDGTNGNQNCQTNVKVCIERTNCLEFFLSPSQPRKVERVPLSILKNVKNRVMVDITFKNDRGITTSGIIHCIRFAHFNESQEKPTY
jgi:hypothetical protein